MTAIRPSHTHAPAQRAHEIQVTPSVGKPVTLRVRGMTLGGAGAAQPKPSATLSVSTLSSAIKTALEPTAQLRTAHVARVMPTGAALELPGPLQTIANAAQALPDALKGILVRGAVTLLGPRLAALALPTVTLAATLYPRQMGDASLPFVPMNPKSRADAEGFNPLGPHDPVQQGVPHTEYTRPDTPMIREHPITATTESRRLEGGPRVEAPTVPGKAWRAPHAADYVLLSDGKTKLTFSDVVITSPKDSTVVQDGGVSLNFQAGEYGEGKISLRWANPGYRNHVVATVEKSVRMPDRLAGEILAHALGYEVGFIPRTGLRLRVINSEDGMPTTGDAAFTVGRWALALHGHRTAFEDRFLTPKENYALGVWPDFQTTSHVFDAPTVLSGHQGHGWGLATPRAFINLMPTGRAASPPDAQGAEYWRRIVGAGDGPMDERPKDYVIPASPSSGIPVAAKISASPNEGHPYIAQGLPVVGAGKFKPTYDFDWKAGNVRTQWLTDESGHYEPKGIETKQTTEATFQAAGLDGDLRWFPVYGKPVSTDPFAGLMVKRAVVGGEVVYEVTIPDARALEVEGSVGQLEQKSKAFEDLASLMLEPVVALPGWVRVRDIQLVDGMSRFLPTFVGQALAAVQSDLPFNGLIVGAAELDKSARRAEDFIDGLTRYGLDKRLGEFSPEVPFVLQRVTESGDIELTINPAVRTSR